MLKVLKFWRQEKNESKELSYLFYQMIVAQIRREWFYTDLHVADTPFGRFELMTIHLFLFLRRLKGENNTLAAEISQKISDYFVIDLDESLRELRISETKVAKQFNKFIQGFYGRLVAYDKAFEEGRDALKIVVHRNLYAGEAGREVQIEVMTNYINAQGAFLQNQNINLLQFKDIEK
ncbi:ubiquinol-cytochrome C chaperone family protein [Candidatus Paracaedibacter symbiosus]|uniref:ubiquinol-cytochrome C chaperone family protein n=1 Tax=Candidatus Paracaedibacter symbiosus TaxID=244582 RepID=UPI00068AE00A|nr:ubiquinol-cytochrome C chaperone family protein [Candidatus Paracaedibacter symbiosus]